MNILVFENNENDFNQLSSCVKHYFAKETIDYQIHRCKNKNELFQAIKQYDLLFLDIELDEDNGIDLGMELKKNNHDCRIMITTNYAKYAIDGYKINADRYFIKPINQQKFNIEMNAIVKTYLRHSLGFFDEKISHKKIYIKDILYIEFKDRKTDLHFTNGEIIPTNYSLKYWYQQLEDKGFAYPYKAYLVNMQHILQFTTNNLKLINNEDIPLSRHYKEEFEKAYEKYLHESL